MPTIAHKILHFPLTKIVIGIVVVAGAIAVGQLGSGVLAEASGIDKEYQNVIQGIVTAGFALAAYIFLFRFYEKREITELSLKNFRKNAALGFLTGLTLQSLVILVIYLYGGYHIIRVAPVSFLLPGFTIGLTSAIVEELIIRGIIFRITEEKLGSVIALIISALLFGFLHLPNKGATVLSALAIALQAGVLLAATYMYSRSLWLPIFLHFAWNFAEAGIYGAIISGNVVEKTLITASITGPDWITGGSFGPENSVQATVFCLIAIAFLYGAKKRGNFIKPYWAKETAKL